MNIHFAPDSAKERRVNIKVVGVGGAGGNAVNRMIEAGLSEVDFYAVNTDGQALDTSRAHQTLIIGSQLTRGLGAGGDPQVGRAAAEEDRELLAALVEDADMVFVTAGMGGGTGTGAAPVVAEEARKSGALTVAVVSRPFLFEGFRRMDQAEQGLAALREHVDALLVIPNERLMEIDLNDGGMTEVFRVADNVLYEATRGISDIIAQHAVVNLDFADVRTVMKDSGAAIMGTGRASGENRASLAADAAIRSPLLENVDIAGSRAVLVYITAKAVDRDDLRGAMGHIQHAAGADAHIFFGFANDEAMDDDVQVTVIATGFPAGQTRPEAAAPSVAVPLARPEPAPAPEPATPAEVAGPEAAPEDQPREPAALEFAEPAAAAPEARPAPERDSREAAFAEPPRREAARDLAALAAEAGGRAREVVPEDPSPAAPVLAEGPVAREPSETSRRFLDPLGAVKLSGEDQPASPTQASQRFRSSVLGDDKLRPAWERKYVD